MSMQIISNQAKCLVCDDAPFSAHVHDYTSCKCGAMAVDGGTAYIRRMGDPDQIEEQSVSIPTTVVGEAVAELEAALTTGRNELGLFCAAVRVLRDAGVDFGAVKWTYS